jgi:NAD(P)H-dependent FMN reductase
MITIIAGTNRKNSRTEIVARQYEKLILAKTDEQVHYFSLQNLPEDTLNSDMYSPDGQSKELGKIQDKILIPASKWVLILPEYNGTFPGVFKLFIDAISIREYGATFKNKKLAIACLSSGREGNLRGLDQLTNAMQYLGFSVLSYKLPLSLINDKMDESRILDSEMLEAISNHVQTIVNY